MKRLWTLSATALLGLATLAPAVSAAPAQREFRRPPRVVVRGGFYGGAWYDPYYAPYWGPTYVVPPTGDLKIKTPVKDASVYIDGGYVGMTNKVKEVPLTPGTHSVELVSPTGVTVFQDNVGVTLGKTTEIRPLAYAGVHG